MRRRFSATPADCELSWNSRSNNSCGPTIFASGVYDLRIPSKRCIAKGLSYANDPTCINEAMLRAWLHDPEALLPQAPNGIDGKPGTIRGMPNLQLSPTAIDQLVAFLETLK